MNAANSQIAAVQALTERQADAIAALDAATNDRLNAISVATQQGIINLYQVSCKLQASLVTDTPKKPFLKRPFALVFECASGPPWKSAFKLQQLQSIAVLSHSMVCSCCSSNARFPGRDLPNMCQNTL